MKEMASWKLVLVILMQKGEVGLLPHPINKNYLKMNHRYI
jgi:hypothetical protein